MIALVIFGLIVAAAMIGPLVAPHPPAQINMGQRLAPSSASHLLGTDDLGRDILTRLFYGARTSLLGALIAVTVAFVIGLPAGLIAGYFGGWWSRILGRIADALMCFPFLLLAMAIIAALGAGLLNAMIAVGIAFSPRIYRVVFAATIVIRPSAYIEAGRVSGTSRLRMLTRHILPNVASPVIVQVSVMLSMAVLAEAGLSYLGLGVTPPDPSWGGMLSRAFLTIRTSPTAMYWPGLAIAATTLSLSVIGDALRDSMGQERTVPPRRLREKGKTEVAGA